MGCFPPLRQSPPLRLRPAGGARAVPAIRGAAAMAALAMTVSCSAGVSPSGSPSAPPAAAASAAGAAPVTAGINQLRDDYSRQIIAIQLTNTTAGALTVLAAGLTSPLYAGAVAGIRLEPELEVSADAQSAVLGLAITPRRNPGSVNPVQREP